MKEIDFILYNMPDEDGNVLNIFPIFGRNIENSYFCHYFIY